MATKDTAFYPGHMSAQAMTIPIQPEGLKGKNTPKQ